MTHLEIEIAELTIQLTKALKELEDEGNGFIDKSKIEKVFQINHTLQVKLNIKNK